MAHSTLSAAADRDAKPAGPGRPGSFSGSASKGSASLGQILLDRGLLTADQLKRAIERQARTRQRLAEVLVDLGLSTPDAILAALSAQLGVPSTRLNVYTISDWWRAPRPRARATFTSSRCSTASACGSAWTGRFAR